MKSLSEINSIINANKPFLTKKFHVKTIGVFGSYIRHEETKNSDIDILVEFSSPIGWDFFDLQDYLEKILQIKVDLVTKDALKSQLKNNILSEVSYA